MKSVYKFEFSRDAEEQFSRFDKPLKVRILKKLDFFQSLPNPLSQAKALKGYESCFRYRVGDYRIIFKPKNRETFVILLILKIAHRREIYE
mgnify:CR=1 FL=1